MFSEWLIEAYYLRIFLQLSRRPHYTTLQKFSCRINGTQLEKIISSFILLISNIRRIFAGINSTGFKITHALQYVVIAVNARSYIPTVIDSQGSVKQFTPPNAAYTMTGNEKYVNSGWLLPKGQEQVLPGSSTSFTVTFQKAGTYHYICQLHPWMRGSVVVK